MGYYITEAIYIFYSGLYFYSPDIFIEQRVREEIYKPWKGRSRR